MNEPKPLASLTPGLLARKGAARPAMRPQLQPMRAFHEATARQLDEDLGWNDMGHDHAPEGIHAEEIHGDALAEQAPAEVVAIAPEVELPTPVIEPDVVRQQKALTESFPAPVPAQTMTPSPAPARARAPRNTAKNVGRRSALADGRRAAFTLRLDAERHLKLRLACTISNRSAQQMVTEALDHLIAELPDVAALAQQLAKKN